MTDLTKTELTYLFDLLNDDTEYLSETLAEMIADTADFTVGNYRFIQEDSIEDIIADELVGDTYVLGSIASGIIAHAADIPVEAVEALQGAEAFEALGQMIVPHIHELVAELIRWDGYGPYFAHYDGVEHYVGSHYAFRIE